MTYLGNSPTTQSFIAGTDYFNGTGSATAFTLSRSVVSVNDIQATVNNVVQVPNDAYTVSGTTITFTSAPSAGTNNVYVRYLSTTTQSITPSQNTVSYSTLNSDNQSKLGISFKNRIINGAMTIWQRGTSASLSGTNTFSADRWAAYCSTGTATASQSSDAPTGFVNSYLYTQSSAGTRNTGDYYEIYQKIEGYNIADLNLGTANAKTFTLSFWAKSSVTGVYSAVLKNSATTYQNYVSTYTITAANTWQQFSITIPGSTAGTWNTTNGSGLELWLDLGSGATYQTSTLNSWITGNSNALSASTQVGFAQTAGATFQFTGVQLEVGTQATTFDYRSYGTELSLCQRYFYLHASGTMRSGSVYTAIMNSAQWSTTTSYGYVQFPTTMRSTPTVYQNTGTAYYILYAGGATQNVSSFSLQDGGPTSVIIWGSNSGSVTVGTAGWVETSNASALLGFNAEL